MTTAPPRAPPLLGNRVIVIDCGASSNRISHKSTIDLIHSLTTQCYLFRCAGRSKCNLEASVNTFGEDACPRVHKYLEVHFNCTAPGFRPSVPAGGAQLNPTSAALAPNSSGKCPLADFTNPMLLLSLFLHFLFLYFLLLSSALTFACAHFH